METSNDYLSQSIMRQLINPSLNMDLCEKVLLALNEKSVPEKKKLLATLQKNTENFKESAKDFASHEVYEEMCNKIRTRIEKCGKHFKVTLADILSLTENTGIKLTDVGWDFLSPHSIAEMIDENVIGQHEYTKLWSFQVLRLFEIYVEEQMNLFSLMKEVEDNEDDEYSEGEEEAILAEQKICLAKYKQKVASIMKQFVLNKELEDLL